MAKAATKPASKAVATKAQSAPASYNEDGFDNNNLPAHMRGDVGKGQDRIGSDDIETPRIKLMQGLSPELDVYNDLRPGMFFHGAAEHIFDDGKFRGVPLFYTRSIILWNPRDSGGGILARADDGMHWSPPNAKFTVKLDKKDGGDTVTWETKKTVAESGLARWGTMNPNDTQSPPAATLMCNFLLAFPDFPDLLPAVLTYQRSSIKKGKRLNAKLKTIRAPMFGCVFEFESVKDKNRVGQDFYNIDARGVGMVEDPELYKMYRDMNEQFTLSGLNIKDIDDLQDEGGEVDPDDRDDDETASEQTGTASRRGGATKPGQRPRY